MTEMDAVRALLGKQVKVTYRNGVEGHLIAEGQLLGFGDGGDFEILDSCGFVHYGWPMLAIVEVGRDR